jgi:formylglycine-generating enzyme required for sulfatase activity
MGQHLDPSFAKLRTSRPEAPQVEPVGAFHLDESPYGVRDLAGGVGDWTSTFVDGAPAPRMEDLASVPDDRQAYWRGGNWGLTLLPREMRYPMAISRRYTGTGFRLALSLDENGSSSLETEPMR